MSVKIYVKPSRENLPPHPADGPLSKEGGYWTADQYTFRMIRDGDLIEADDPAKFKGKKGA